MKRKIGMKILAFFIICNTFAFSHVPSTYAGVVLDKGIEPIVYQENDLDIIDITSEKGIEKYINDPVGTQMILFAEEKYAVVHRFSDMWNATCQHVAHDEWVEYRIYRDGKEEKVRGCITYHQFPEDSYDPNNHNWGEWKAIEVKPATATEEGYIKYERTCQRGVGYWANRGNCTAKEYKTERAMDLSADFERLPSSAAKGEEVVVGVNVNSTFDGELKDVPFEWKITKKSGGAVSATFFGHSNVGKGTLKIPANGEQMLYAKFIMPDSDVDIKFEINKDGKNPPEISLNNNVLNSGEAVKLVSEINSKVQFDLDYNILSRKVTYPLASKDIKAVLTKDKGMWKGNATGELIVENNAKNLFREYHITNNALVDEDKTTIIRNPDVHIKLLRSDFENGRVNLPNPKTALIKRGDISFGGTVKRLYEYTYFDGCGTKDKSCPGHTRSPFAYASFDSGENTGTILTFVYNGKQNVVPKEKFKTEVVPNNSKPNSNTMYWKSEPYEFNVFRLMYEKGEDNKLSTPIKVNGLFKRNFVNQDMADTSWSVSRSMKDEYSKSRSAAKRRDTSKSLLDKAVFASDKQFDSKAYPIKSGYYFNPTGTYTFTIKTETYKPNKGKTDDHEDIVNAFKNAFRYESNLVYKSKSGQAVDLLNNAVKRGSKGYKGQMAILTVNKSTGLYGKEWIQVDSDYKRDDEEEVYFPQSIDERNGTGLDIDIKADVVKDVNGVLDQRWKNILEGYNESSTRDSFSEYKYREYVDDSGKYKKMYKVTETTKVTIKINTDNTKAYTHDTMADGDYMVKAYIDKISFKNNAAYSSLSLNSISALDKIEIEVVGSKSDDINVN